MAKQSMNGQSITAFSRYDDFSTVSHDTVDRDLVETFQRYDLSCTFAVIPLVTEGNDRDPAPRGHVELAEAKRELLKHAAETGVVDVALHGLNHRSNSQGMPHSEFYGLDYATQSSKIREGKACPESMIARWVVVLSA